MPQLFLQMNIDLWESLRSVKKNMENIVKAKAKKQHPK